jgi:hypothetical protein
MKKIKSKWAPQYELPMAGEVVAAPVKDSIGDEMRCDCGKGAFWRGDRVGHRYFSCEDCGNSLRESTLSDFVASLLM